MYLAWHQSYSLSGIYSKLPVTSSRFILSSMILYLLTVKCLCPYIQRPKIWKPAYLFGPMRLQKVKQESISFVKNNLMLQIFWLNSANYYISWRFEIILKMGADLRNVLCNHRCQNNYEENISYFKASAVSADGLSPPATRTSTNSVMITTRPRVYSWPSHWMIPRGWPNPFHTRSNEMYISK